MPVRPEQIKLRRRNSFRSKRRRSGWPLKVVVVCALLACMYLGYEWVVSQPRILPQKLVILGFEGADLGLVQKYWPDLPNLQRLAQTGYMGSLATLFPPDRCVTWSSFAVGAGPGVHGIFGSIMRLWGTYSISPDPLVRREDPSFLWGLVETRPLRFTSARLGEVFWDVLSQERIQSVLIQVPLTFPPPDSPFVTCLSGSCPADITGQRVSFHHFSTRYQGQVEKTPNGGLLVPVFMGNEGWYTGIIAGPLNTSFYQKLRRLKDKQLEIRLKRMEILIALWLMDRTSPTLLSDRENYRQTLARLAADLRLEPAALRNKHFPIIERLQAILADPEGPQAAALFKRFNHTAKARLHAELDRYEKNEDSIAEQRRTLEGEGGLPKAMTTVVRFLPVNDQSAKVELGGKQATIRVGEWSSWFRVKFSVSPLKSIYTMTRFYLQSVSPQLEVFMASFQVDPREPPLPISNPADLAKRLARSQEVGVFETADWAAETAGLDDGKLDEQAFMQDLMQRARLREAITLYAYKRDRFNLFVSVFSSTDRAAHMMYRLIDPGHPAYDPDLAARLGDAIKQVYVHMDGVVGRMLDLIDKNTVLLVLSTHGICPYRYTVSLNRWLVEQGYLVLNRPGEETQEQVDTQVQSARSFLELVDWSKSKAYALGPGHIYINLRGREPRGIVGASEYGRLCREIRTGLLNLRDYREGHSGELVVRQVAIANEIWKGPSTQGQSSAPDIQVGFEEGYHVSRREMFGGISTKVIVDNTHKWSGDHSSVSPDLVPGVIFCNRPIKANAPSVVDLAPTVLAYFDLPIPPSMEGKRLLRLHISLESLSH